MKKFLNEFKEFALKGNVVDLAVGVIIGAAFKDIVTSLTDNIINPIINCFGGAEVGGSFQIFKTGQYINYGAFITAVINFLIMAFVIFIFVKAIASMNDISKKLAHKKEEAAAPTTKKCPFCCTEIDIKATRCPHCTSELPVEEEKE